MSYGSCPGKYTAEDFVSDSSNADQKDSTMPSNFPLQYGDTCPMLNSASELFVLHFRARGMGNAEALFSSLMSSIDLHDSVLGVVGGDSFDAWGEECGDDDDIALHLWISAKGILNAWKKAKGIAQFQGYLNDDEGFSMSQGSDWAEQVPVPW